MSLLFAGNEDLKVNHTLFKEFTLLGLTDNPVMKAPLFMLFLMVYIFTVLGNIGIMALIYLSPTLKTPMYFFLAHLSFLDLCYSSVIAPKMLRDLLSKKKSISIPGCVMQLFFFCTFGGTEAMLLGAMAYDRFVAVCQPLHYTSIMTKPFSIWLMVGVFTGGVVHSLIETGCTFRLTFCHWDIHHFCCDIPPLLKLSCTDTFVNEVVLFVCAACFCVVPLLVILFSYTSIIVTIFQMSATKRVRVFSKCSSHFIGVTLYYGTVLFTYLRPSSSYSLDQDKAATVFYTMVIPMLNPLIYSLRNKDVVEALSKVIGKRTRTLK